MIPKDLIASTILSTAIARGTDKSTCPSEIARMLFPENWRIRMGEVRDVAIALQQEGKVLITQKGIPIEIDHIKGPIRIKIVSIAQSSATGVQEI
jgi:hypothetical protein